MSIAQLTHICAACGAEESLDVVLGRMVEDEMVRLLISDAVIYNLAVGAQVVRYLRLHKPPKHRLRLERVRAVLGELMPDMRREAIYRKGREWPVSTDGWREGFKAVFDAAAKGVLTLPLEGNAYLYEVLLRQADRTEAQVERGVEERRKRRSSAETSDVAADALGTDLSASLFESTPRPTTVLPTEPRGPVLATSPPPGYDQPSPYARRVREQNAARQATAENHQDDT